MTKKTCSFLLLITAWLWKLPAAVQGGATEAEPFHTRHLSPPSLVFGLPPAENAQLLPSYKLAGRLLLEGANNHSRHFLRNGDELLLDGETYRITAAFRIGLARGLEVGFDLPYLRHERGSCDGLINNFHEEIGVGNSRSRHPDNHLAYRYIREGRPRFQLTRPVSGPGDILLLGAYQLYRLPPPASRAIALRASLKLPTGDADKLTGSGGFDLSVGLAGSDSRSLAAYRVTVYGMLGGLYLGEGEFLPELQRHLAAFGNFGVSWQPLSWAAVKLQLDGHTAFFGNSGMRPLDSWAAQLAGGFTFALPGAVFLDLALLENIFVETAPDVALHLVLRREF